MIENIPFFKTLCKKDLDRLGEISFYKSYKKDEILFFEGQSSKWLYLLTKGNIKIYKTSPKGKEIFLREIRPISFVAELANFENIPYPASSIMLTDGEILKIDYSKFRDEFLLKPEICFEMLKSISKKLISMNDVFTKELILDSEGKIAKFICENFEAFTTLKYNQISKILNLSPETFSRIITKFKKDNLLIVNSNQQIVSFNKDSLSKFYIT
ncbi:putative nitrosative stress-response regulator NssR, Crp/Fnr family [Campylobacter blaseri]|uniref:Transcriptional regulator n=1 Tax=Campylobacter blaseri TaxID=2042961 RepID=A0A2P8R003_9BACT|nr:Crp/Fnr family transcriptional regulator [Campylobacter blaseri]PSM51818.1 transcriptional regulator [Campylobacter blaseri]PSM53609.1 transcriptional regulator [Campylobacter blaseri]QKF86420.1 putative nitrosative stress-response regulator NssR, Crp/Fnr family [Campylobacter blaseri]